MSSRLVILPKKSWNVWNQDNIEKVKRDERLAAEAAAATEQRAREIEQERRVDELKRRKGRPAGEKDKGKDKDRKRKRDAGGPAGEGQGWGGVDRHVNLFEAAELANKASGGNADYEKEQREKELKEQRQSGLYPTALGGENPKEKPWWYGGAGSSAGNGVGGGSSGVSGYGAGGAEAFGPPPKTVVRGRTLVGEDADMALQRDAARKAKADPMRNMVRRRDAAEAGAAAAAAAAGAAIGSRARGSSSGTGYSGQRGAAAAGSSDQRHSQMAAALAAAGAGSGSVEEMRQRRLQRERAERSREASLLSRMQPWSPVPDDRDREFNSQYHPERARKKR